jgi:tRNA (cmo5U34)-methyltransferase
MSRAKAKAADVAVDHTEPQGRWEFDEAVTAAFDDMLARSIPQYEVMRRTVFDLACRFVRPQTAVIDLGCSRGEALAQLVERFGAHNRFVGVDCSAPMLAAARHRFSGYIDAGVVQIRDMDLRREYPPEAASVTLCVLTLQFVPIEYRLRLVRDVWRHTLPGGALVLVEKVLGATADLDALFADRYLGLKAEHGYSADQIERKRLSLEGVLVPVTAAWNEQILRAGGFDQIDCFWRWANFAGWVAVRGERQ